MSDEVNKGGRKPTELTEEQVRQLEVMAPFLNQDQIGAVLGVPARTLRAVMSRDDDVAAAYKRGKAKLIMKAGKSLSKLLDLNDFRAVNLVLRAQAGWAETQEDEEDLPPLAVNVVDTSTDSDISGH